MQECLNCNKPFEPNYSGQLYCCLVCKKRARYRRAYYKAKARYNQQVAKEFSTVNCKGCSSTFSRIGNKKIYCSSKCKDRYRSKIGLVITKKSCAMCAKEFDTHKKNKKFCNLDCTVKFNQNKFNKLYPKGLKSKRRLQALKRCSRCESCGTGNFLVLQVHHINTVVENNKKDHTKDNLMTLCSNCHIFYHRLVGRGYKTENQVKDFVLDTIKNGVKVSI